VHPLRTDIPILMGAEGPNNVAHRRPEIADGCSRSATRRQHDHIYAELAERGFRPARLGGTADDSEVLPLAIVVINDYIEASRARLRPMLRALHRGHGGEGGQLHFDLFVRMGYDADAPTSRTSTWRGTADGP